MKKEKNKRKLISNVFKIMKLIWGSSKESIIIESILMIVETVEQILRVFMPALIIQHITTGERIQVASIIVIVIIAIISFCGLASRLLRALLTAYSFRMSNQFRSKLSEKQMGLDYEYSEDEENLNRYNLVKSTSLNFDEMDYMIINNLLNSVIIFIVMSLVLTNISLFLYILVIIFSLATYYIGKKSAGKVHFMENEKEELLSRKAYMNELLYNIEGAKEIRIYSASDFIIGKMQGITDNLEKIDIDINKYKFKISSLKDIISFLQSISIFIHAIYKYGQGEILLGAFYIYVSAGREFVDSIISIINSINEIKEASLYFDDYDQYMSIKENMYESQEAKYHIAKAESIEFIDVSFKYKNGQSYALKNINCVFKANEKIAIVGDNGAGKTTFIKLLLRLYDVDEGEIKVNGINIKEYYYDEYLRVMSSVFQDAKMVGYSLLENIVLDNEVDNERLEKSINISGIGDRIKTLKDGLSSIVSKDLSEDGINFSGGEEQKIAIARALYKNMDSVILDEPTAAMDALAEKELFDKFNDSLADSMIIYITHRLSNVAFCDRILVFEDGGIVESGQHKDLIKNNGLYADMYQKQAFYYAD